MRKVAVRVNERGLPLIVRIAAADDGFECTLGAIDAWHHYNGNSQRRGKHNVAGKQQFWSWCFDGLEIATAARRHFGDEPRPVATRSRLERAPGRHAAGSRYSEK